MPSCEFFPQQAVLTNVTGSDNVIRAAERSGAHSVVCLSTDKAVYPINAMGMSKAMMEKVAQAHARHRRDDGPVVSVTRYGNVMHSRGSVIPVFVDQVLNKQPLTVTNPDMTRFLMSLDESVDLVEYAFENAVPGDLFVRKAPASTVRDLALAVASLFGVDDPEIRTLGTRHGEKLYESLLTREELQKADDQGEFYRVPLDARSLEYELFFDEGERDVVTEDYTSHNTDRLDVEGVKACSAAFRRSGGPSSPQGFPRKALRENPGHRGERLPGLAHLLSPQSTSRSRAGATRARRDGGSAAAGRGSRGSRCRAAPRRCQSGRVRRGGREGQHRAGRRLGYGRTRRRPATPRRLRQLHPGRRDESVRGRQGGGGPAARRGNGRQ